MSNFIRRLKLSGAAAMCSIFLASMLLANGCAVTEVDTKLVEDTFLVGSSARLVVTIENGSIRVESAGPAVGTVQIAATIRNPDRVHYNASVENNTVSLTGEVDGGFSFFGGSGGVDIVVRVPLEIGLDLKGSNGQITVDGVDGPISVATSNGQVSIANSVGDIRANTSNGRIAIADTRGQIDAHTSNGAINFRGTLPAGSTNTLRTSNGGIEVELVNTPSVELSAITNNGRVYTALPLTITGELDDNRLEGTIGDGGSNLEIRTSNGSINIK